MPRNYTLGPIFRGACDASGVAETDGGFVVASDEPNLKGQNRLYFYDWSSTTPRRRMDLNTFLQSPSDRPEADIESAALLDNRIFWITSHGRNAKGVSRPGRNRFFAIEKRLGSWQLVGQPYTQLLDDLVARSVLLLACEARALAPERGGISIEGLCAGHRSELWIGFRSPLSSRRALAAAILNPHDVIRGQRARIGSVWEMSLGGRGIRDWTKIDENQWLILAGSSRSRDEFALYAWNGHPNHPPQFKLNLTQILREIRPHFAPEGILYRSNGEIWLFSDDGDRKFEGDPNKFQPEAQRRFRTVKLTLCL